MIRAVQKMTRTSPQKWGYLSITIIINPMMAEEWVVINTILDKWI